MTATLYWLCVGCAAWHGARGFWLDIIKQDRAASVYHIAWLGVFLASILRLQ